MNFKKTFLKNLFIAGGYTYLTQIITFLASIVTSRLLTPADFGVAGLIAVFSGFISMFSESTISLAVIRSPYRYTYYKGINIVSILAGIVLCLLTLMVLYPFALYYKNDTIILPGIAVAGVFIVKGFNIVPLAVLQKKLRFAAAGKIVLLANLSGVLCTIVLAAAGYKYWSLIWSQYAIAIATWLLLEKRSDQSFYTRNKMVVIKSFIITRAVIGRLIGFNTINYWARNADNLLVGKYYSTADLGIYNRAYQMLTMPLALITGIFTSVLYPSLVRHKANGGSIESEYHFMLKIISILNFPVAFLLILLPKQFVDLMWGEQWISVSKLLPYFGLLVLTQTLFSTTGSILLLEAKEKLMMYSGWLSALMMIGGIVLGATISLSAIAAFYALSFLVLVLPFNILYVFRYKLRYNTEFLIFWVPKLILSVIMWVGIYFSMQALVIAAIILWVCMILWDTRIELRKIVELFWVKPFGYKNYKE